MTFTFTFKGGKRLLKTIAATAGNVVTNLAPGVGKRWLVMFGAITLDTDAAAANRRIQLQTTNGTVVTTDIGYSATIIADKIGIVDLNVGTDPTNFTLGPLGADIMASVTCKDILLESTDQLRITISNGQAGDSYSGYVTVLEIDV